MPPSYCLAQRTTVLLSLQPLPARPAVKKSVELAPASSPRSAATPGGTAPLTPSSASSPPHPLRRSRLAVTNNQSCFSTPSEELSDPPKKHFRAFSRFLTHAPRGYQNGRASARHPRSGATPKKHFRAFSQFLAHAPRGYQKWSCVSTPSEELSDPRRCTPANRLF